MYPYIKISNEDPLRKEIQHKIASSIEEKFLGVF